MRTVAFFLLLGLSPAVAADKVSAWESFERRDFQVDGRNCLLIVPKTAANGKPWIWRTEFFGHEPQADIALAKLGFHVAYMDVQNMYGAPVALDHMDRFYEHLTRDRGLAKRTVLEGFSRGGLFALNWAARHPDRVACIYNDAPVCDFKSWPGGKGKGPGSTEDWKRCLKAYGLTEAEAMAYKLNPVDNLEPLAKGGVPLLHVCGDADEAVPFEENTVLLAERYRKLGGTIKVIAKKGVKHHPHSLKDPTPIVQFVLAHTASESRITHGFLATGGQTYIRDDNGDVIWRYPHSTRDGWLLDNGNVLLAMSKSKTYPGGGVVEVTRDGKVVMTFQGTQAEVNTVQRLADGRTLLTEAGAKPRLLEIDREGSVVIDVPLTAQTRDHHLQTRMARKLSNGHYLVPQLLDKVVREYTAEGKIVWEVKTPDMPFTAIRLDDGHTLIGCTLGHLVIEVDAKGKEVWRVTNADLPGRPINDACGVQRLANGNTVITSHHAGTGDVKLTEVTRDKKVVWSHRDQTVGGIHHFQILVTNGKKEAGRPMR